MVLIVKPKFHLCAVIVAVVLALFATPPVQAQAVLEGNISCHDPHAAKEGSRYYLFCTSNGTRDGFIPIRCSNDMKHWSICSRVFDALPAWIHQDVPKARGAWAPDISNFSGKWHVYYAVSSFGKNTSAIGLATNKTLDPSSKDYQWEDGGMVIKSTPADDWNAIDANIIVDQQRRVWMDLGSFWSGIKMVRIDAGTGKRSTEDGTLYSLARRSRNPPIFGSIEGAFIFHHDNYYYLFASFDFCCRGAASTYNIRVGRSQQPIGPYVDEQGAPMLDGGGTLIQGGNADWRGPGHNSIIHTKSGDYIFFHAYQATTGRPYLQIGKLEWNNGWPTIRQILRPAAEALH